MGYKGYFKDDDWLKASATDEATVRATVTRTSIPSRFNDPKPTNPKESVGIRKAAMSTVSAPVLAEVGVSMMEGARKYGRHNYRDSGVLGSVYYDATFRHLFQWWEGEDIDPDSGLSHVTKAITSLIILRDAMIAGNFVDDRPPKAPEGWLRELQAIVEGLFEKYPDCVPAFTEVLKET